MSKYTRKKRLRSEDEFLDFWQKMYKIAEPYAAAIGVVVATAVVICFAVWGWNGYHDKKAQGATELFGRAAKIYDADLLTDQAPPKTDEENPVPRFKTEKERADATLAELAEIDKKYPGSDVGRDAELFRAGVLFDLGRYDEAQATYKKIEQQASDPPLKALAHEGRGLCLESRGQLDEALVAYRELEPKTGDFYRDRALFDEARIYARKGDKKKAADLYKEVLAKMPSTTLRDEIQTRLAILEVP